MFFNGLCHMNAFPSGLRRLYHAIFILIFIALARQVWADDPQLGLLENAQGIVDLHLCADRRLGVELLCNRSWQQDVDRKEAVMMVIQQDPAVLLTVARINEPVTGIDELTEAMVRMLGQYANGFKYTRLEVNGLPAVKVEGFSQDFPEMRLMDYYVVHDYRVYSFMFSVNPKDEWPNYSVLFDKIAESIRITGDKI